MQPRERTRDGALIVREGLPERWHYTVAINDNPKLQVFRGQITVMFDGGMRCSLVSTNLSTDEEQAVEVAREKVLAWIADYHKRNGPGDPPVTEPEDINP